DDLPDRLESRQVALGVQEVVETTEDAVGHAGAAVPNRPVVRHGHEVAHTGLATLEPCQSCLGTSQHAGLIEILDLRLAAMQAEDAKALADGRDMRDVESVEERHPATFENAQAAKQIGLK